MPQRFTVRCECCEGTRYVAIIRTRDPLAQLVPELCNRPMAVTTIRASLILRSYRARDPRGIVVRSMADRLSAILCPHCKGTGIAYTLTFEGPP